MKKQRVHTGGFRPRVSTRRAVATEDVAPWLAPDDGAEPFWAEIRDDLTFAELASIPTNPSATFREQWDVIAPWVVDWNATAFDVEKGEWMPVPPPADGGPDVFTTQSKRVTLFLVLCLAGNLDLNLPKGRRPIAATGDGSNAAGLDSPLPETP